MRSVNGTLRTGAEQRGGRRLGLMGVDLIELMCYILRGKWRCGMAEEEKGLLLLGFYFGEAAGVAAKGASRRLKLWSWGFERWVEARREAYGRDAVKQSLLAWRRFVQQCGKMPWEVRREDVQAHTRWMEEIGFKGHTISQAIGLLESFYRWSAAERVDPGCEVGFNPAEGVRQSAGRYEGVEVWRRTEVEWLVERLRADGSALGKRGLAFFLLRLESGASTKRLLAWQWGEEAPGFKQGVARDMEGETRVEDAVEAWLRASGRLARMQAGKYVFTRLKEPGREGVGGKAEDWVEEKPLSNDSILRDLKLYGRLAGIEEGKLTLMALRRTAIWLRLEAGESLEGMKQFMESREEEKFTRSRLKKLRERLEDAGKMGEAAEGGEMARAAGAGMDVEKGLRVPVRQARPFKAGEHVKHGKYMKQKPVDAVKAVMREKISGMNEEVAGLRELLRGLLERGSGEMAWGEAYSRAANRLAGVIKQERRRKPNKENDEYLEGIRRMCRIRDDEEWEQWIEAQWGEERKLVTGGLEEEVATIRYWLRNSYRRARETEELQEYVRMVDLYSSGCVRLAGLIHAGGDETDWLIEKIKEEISEALEEVAKELFKEREGI